MWAATTGTAFPAEVDTGVPDGVTARQLRAVVEKYLREHPAELHADAAGLVYVAVREVWRASPVSYLMAQHLKARIPSVWFHSV